MFLTMKTATVLLLIVASQTGVGILGCRVLAQRQQATEPPARIAGTRLTNAELQKRKEPRLDLYGDPLPEGAIARLGTVRLYHRGPVRLPFNSPVRSLLYSPDGKTVFSGGWTETIRCWDVDSGKEVRQFVIPQEKMPAGEWLAATSFTLSPDGKTLATGTLHGPMDPGTGGFPPSQQGLFFLWEVASGKLLYRGQGDGGSLAFSHNGKVLASAGGSGEQPRQVRLWEVSTGKELRRLPAEGPGNDAAAFSPISDTLAVVSRNSTIFIMDAAAGNVLHKLLGHVNVVTSIVFSRDGKTLASIEAGRPQQDPEFCVRLWSVESGKLLQRLGHQSWVSAIAFGADGMLAAADEDGIHFWNSQSGKQLRHSSGPVHCSSVGSSSLAFSPDGKTLAYGNGDGVISFWDAGTAAQIGRMSRHQAGLHSVAISPDGRTLATGSGDRSIGLWDVASAKELRNLRGHKFRVQFVAFSPNGKLLASASFDDYEGRNVDIVFLWDMATGEIVQRLKGRCIAFSPDGKQFAYGGLDDERPGSLGIIRLRDVETGKLTRRFHGHKTRVDNIAFSPDGTPPHACPRSPRTRRHSRSPRPPQETRRRRSRSSGDARSESVTRALGKTTGPEALMSG
jgi:WD40 repeat protein